MSERLAGPSSEAAAPRAGVPLQTRGVVQQGALYIARRVDELLLAAVRAGRWVVILGPRFSGKSSLRVRTVRGLQGAAPASVGDDTPAVTCRCATIEARSLPAAVSGAVYLALCSAIAAELRLPAVHGFWQRHSDETAVARFRRYLLEEVVTAAALTVILVDDLDALQTLPLDLPELLGALGQVRDVLAAEGNTQRLTLVFFSTVAPERLAAAPAPWPAERFWLADFTRAELAAFGPALAALVRAAEPALLHGWLDAVFDWTAGQPQLTQHLCQQLVVRAPPSGGPAGAAASEGTSDPSDRVERLVRTLFLEQEDTIDEDPCLREMAQRLTRSPQAPALLALYRRLLSGVPVTPDPLDAVQQELRLSGLAAAADDPAGTPRLRPRGRLATTLLGESWAREHEVRLILQGAIASESATDERAPAGKLLRGVPLKNAQAWARKHPEALRPPEVRVLLASLEAARSEAETKHQASAAALQRERRDKTELRPLGGLASAPVLSSQGLPIVARSWIPAVVAVGLSVCLVAAAFTNAHRRTVRLEHTSQEANARALRAEQELLTLRSQRTSPGPAPGYAAHVAPALAAVLPLVASPRQLAAPLAGAVTHPSGEPPRPAAPRQLAAPAVPKVAADRRKPAVASQPAGPKTALSSGAPARHAAAREVGSCPVPGRPAD